MRCNAGRSDRQPTQQTCVLRYLLLYPSNRIHRHNVVPDFSGTAVRELGCIRWIVNSSHRRRSRSRLTPAIHLTITGSSRSTRRSHHTALARLPMTDFTLTDFLLLCEG